MIGNDWIESNKQKIWILKKRMKKRKIIMLLQVFRGAVMGGDVAGLHALSRSR